MTLLERVRNVMDRFRGVHPDADDVEAPARVARVAVEEKPVARGAEEILADLGGRLGAQGARAADLLQRVDERLAAHGEESARLASAMEGLRQLGQDLAEVKRSTAQVAESVLQQLEAVSGRDQRALVALEEVTRREADRDMQARELGRQVEALAQRVTAAVETAERDAVRQEEAAAQRHEDLMRRLERSERMVRLLAIVAGSTALVAVLIGIAALVK